MNICRARASARAVPLLCLLLSVTLSGQSAPPTENVELEPIVCSWRTSTDAVRIGEVFTLTLTCGVLDTAATTVVPDQSRLDPGALQLQPFDVRGGSQAPDLRTPTRRFFQYEYLLRYLGEEAGRDLQVPALTMTYRVQSRVQQNGPAVESRERQYILPAHLIRILSTVPAAARDIRDASPVTLAEIDRRHFRASMFRVASGALYVGAVIVAVWGIVSLARRRRGRATVTVRHVSDAAVLSGVLKELSAVRRLRGSEGWSPDLAARALGALRIAASYAAGAFVVQTPSSGTSQPLSGQLRLRSQWPRGGSVIISGAATSEVLARLRNQSPLYPGNAAQLERLEGILSAFSRAAYGRDAATAIDGLDEPLAEGERAVGALRREHSWLGTRFRALKGWAGSNVKARAWAR